MDRSVSAIDPTFHIEWESGRRFSDFYYEHCQRWVDLARNQELTDFPTQLVLESSTLCNLRCPMCMRKQLGLPRTVFPVRKWASILDEATSWSDFQSLKPNYRNEPTTHPDLARLLELGKEMGVREVIMNTNGNFPESLALRLYRNLTEVAVSIDAATEETYKRVRPGGNFARVCSNVEVLGRLRRVWPDLRVRVAFVVQQENAGEVDAFVRRWKPHVDKIVVNQCYNPGGKGEDRGVVRWVQDPAFSCPQLWQRLVVTATGDVLPCCGAYEGSLSLGNIFEENKSVVDFWHSSRLALLRDFHATGRFREIAPCRTCALTYRPEAPR